MAKPSLSLSLSLSRFPPPHPNALLISFFSAAQRRARARLVSDSGAETAQRQQQQQQTMATTTTRGATLSLLCGAWIMNKSWKIKKTKNPSSGAQHHQASIWHGNSNRKGRTLREMAWEKGMDEDAKEFPYICACYPYSSGIPECKERIHREIVAFVAAWMRFQLDSCNLSSETDMAGAAAAAADAFPPGYLTLLPPVCCLLPAACAPSLSLAASPFMRRCSSAFCVCRYFIWICAL